MRGASNKPGRLNDVLICSHININEFSRKIGIMNEARQAKTSVMANFSTPA